MARKIRLEYAGAAYYALARGNQGRDIYADERDRKLWLATLGEKRVERPAGASMLGCRVTQVIGRLKRKGQPELERVYENRNGEAEV